MSSHPIDFQIQSNLFATPELLAIFDEKARFQRWLDFEAALSSIQGELDIIPAAAAVEIGAKASVEQLDFSAIADGYELSRNSLIPLVNGLRRACKDGYGEYVHFGVTTQDVIDTGQILELKEVFKIVYRDLKHLETILLDMARAHKSTPMVGRTHGQQALPITFGLKVSVWLQEVRRQINRLLALYPRILIGQLSGAVGTMAALGPLAREVAAKTLERLGLGHSAVSWHTSRDNIAEVGSFFALLSGTFEKIANEIFQLGKTEIFELSEPAPKKAMSSSTMPHKRNPVLCQRVAVLARHTRSLANLILENAAHEHERDARCLWSEWLAVPQMCMYTGTAVDYLNTILIDLEIRDERMMDNLCLQKDKVVSEWLMFRLATVMGKMNAQKKLHTLFAKAESSNNTLETVLREDPELNSELTDDDYQMLDHPEYYIGHSVEIVETALAEVLAFRQDDPEELI